MRTKKSGALISVGVICIAIGLFMSSFQFFILGWALLFFCWIPWKRIEVPVRIARGGEPVYLREGDAYDVKMDVGGTAPEGSLITLEDGVPDGAMVGKGSDIILTAKDPATKTAPLWKRGYGLYFPHFGRFRVGPVKVHVWDPFALYTTEGVVDATDEFTIYPAYRDLSHLPGVFSKHRHFQANYKVKQPGVGMEFFHIREYHPGDPMKSINWKAYARTRKWLVNVQEKEVSYSAILIIDARVANSIGTRKHNPLSWSISSALSMSSFLIRTRNEVGVLTYGNDLNFIPPSSTPVQMNRIQEFLINLTPAGYVPFEMALDVAMKEMSPSTVLFLFSSLIADPTLLNSLYWAKLKGIDITVITLPAEFFSKVISESSTQAKKHGASESKLSEKDKKHGAKESKLSEKGKMDKKDKKKKKEEEEDEEDIDTHGYRMMMITRRNYLRELRNIGVRVVDWRPDTPFEKLIETLK